MFSRLLSGLLVSAMLLGSALTVQAQQTLNFGIIFIFNSFDNRRFTMS